MTGGEGGEGGGAGGGAGLLDGGGGATTRCEVKALVAPRLSSCRVPPSSAYVSVSLIAKPPLPPLSVTVATISEACAALFATRTMVSCPSSADMYATRGGGTDVAASASPSISAARTARERARRIARSSATVQVADAVSSWVEPRAAASSRASSHSLAQFVSM